MKDRTQPRSPKREAGGVAAFSAWLSVSLDDPSSIEAVVEGVAESLEDSLGVDLCNGFAKAWSEANLGASTNGPALRLLAVVASRAAPLSQDWLDEYVAALARILGEAADPDGAKERWRHEAPRLFRLTARRQKPVAKTPEPVDDAAKPSTTAAVRMTPEEFAQQIFANLPNGGEERLAALAARLDGCRSAVRQDLEATLREYMKERNPARKEERQRSVALINGLMDRLGFALEHPDSPGSPCYLYVSVDKAHVQGNIRLMRKGGAARPLEHSAHLSRFSEFRVIDAVPAIEPAEAAMTPQPESWSSRITGQAPDVDAGKKKKS